MKKDDHIKYIKDLTKLQDSEGKRISGLMLSAMGKLLRASMGSPQKFEAMVRALKARIVKEVLAEVKRAQLRAKRLGYDFGKQKLNGND